jgi:flagellar biosynthetic protein FliP
VVKIGDQLVAVSVGDGGVRPILEIEPAPSDASASVETPAQEPARGFAPALVAHLRASGLPLLLALALLTPDPGHAQTSRPAPPQPAPAAAAAAARGAAAAPAPTLDQALAQGLPRIDLSLGKTGDGDGLRLSGSVGIVVMMGLLTLLPSLILMMTSFTRILIVLNFVKQALGTQNAPPGQLVAALSLILTGFVMSPTVSRVNDTAITPWLDGRIEQGAMMKAAVVPLRDFMLRQTRESDLATFVELSGTPAQRPEDVSTVVLMSAFVTSELRTAFQLGFVLFLPFIVIDIVVSSVLMSMGMFMLPPAMISLPFKLLLFVLVDGWSLLIQSLVQGFR